jgi:inosose dehydratase
MIKIANAPCSWGILEFDLEGESAGFEQVLDEMKETGYAGTELGDWGFLPSDPQELHAELEKRSLELLGAFVPVALSEASSHAAGVENAVRTADLLARAGYENSFLVLADNNGSIPERTNNAGSVKPGMGLDDTGWETFAEGAGLVASAVREQTGLRTAFHHHCGGYVETPEEIARFLDLTDPDLVGLVFDTGHYRFGGGDPLSGLKENWDRIWHVHFKDCGQSIALESAELRRNYFESVSAGVFCELGQGCVDFPSIATALRSRSYDGWIVVEQDVLPGMGSPLVCAKRNREYLKSLGL